MIHTLQENRVELRGFWPVHSKHISDPDKEVFFNVFIQLAKEAEEYSVNYFEVCRLNSFQSTIQQLPRTKGTKLNWKSS